MNYRGRGLLKKSLRGGRENAQEKKINSHVSSNSNHAQDCSSNPPSRPPKENGDYYQQVFDKTCFFENKEMNYNYNGGIQKSNFSGGYLGSSMYEIRKTRFRGSSRRGHSHGGYHNGPSKSQHHFNSSGYHHYNSNNMTPQHNKNTLQGPVVWVNSNRKASTNPQGIPSSAHYNNVPVNVPKHVKAVNLDKKIPICENGNNLQNVQSPKENVPAPSNVPKLVEAASNLEKKIQASGSIDTVNSAGISNEKFLVSENETPNKIVKDVRPPNSESSGSQGKSHTKSQGKLKGSKTNKNKKNVNKHFLEKCSMNIKIDVSLTFTSQCDSVVSQLMLSEEGLQQTEAVRKDVENVFKKNLKNVRAVIFGSTFSGTAFGNSDLDILLESTELLTVPQVIPHVKDLYSSRLFTSVVKILGARVPIIRARHIRTNIVVDISFTSPYGMTNSIIIKMLCSHDQRIKKFIMIVLFWAKKQEIVSPCLLSSLTVILMCIFYLQVIGMLPPLHKFLEADGKLPWPKAVNECPPELIATSNTEDLYSLLLGFFSFYSSIHFDQVVISPFAGELVLTAYFERQIKLPGEECDKYHLEEKLPPCFSNYLKVVQSGEEKRLVISKMTVQEPTTLNINTTKSLTEHQVSLFKNGCFSALEVINKVSKEYVLLSILSDYCSLADPEKSTANWVLTCPDAVLREDWHQKVYNASVYIFTKILLMCINPPADNSSYNLDIKHSSGKGPILCYNVQGSFDVFSPKREKLLKIVTGSELEREEVVSKILQSKHSSHVVFSFSAAVCVLSNFVNRSVDIKLVNLGNSKQNGHFKQVVSFLKGGKMKNYLSLILEANR